MIPNLTIPTLNQYESLQSLVRCIDYPVGHLLIIDNGGELESVGIPDCVEQCTILNMPSNLGVAASWNLAIKSFPHDPVVYVASDDVMFQPGSLEIWANESAEDRIVVSHQYPFFQIFSVGEEVIKEVGLFDEGLYPANFEDDDYRWRTELKGFDVIEAKIPLLHKKHATIRSSDYFVRRNVVTFRANEKYLAAKKERGDVSSGEWSLKIRRENSWDGEIDNTYKGEPRG
jgi:GT2 family glycosyltransferase